MRSAGTLPSVSTNRSTSRSCTQFDSMFSGVWKSTGVTIVMRFCTLCGCIAAKHSENAPPWQMPSRLILRTRAWRATASTERAM